MQETFTVGPAPRVSIGRVDGNLTVRSGEALCVVVEAEALSGQVLSGERDLNLGDWHDDLLLYLPADARLQVAEVSGDSVVRGIDHLVLQRGRGDLEVEELADGVEVGTLEHDLRLRAVPRLQVRERVAGAIRASRFEAAEIQTVEADCTLEAGSTALIGRVGGEAHLIGLTSSLRCGSIAAEGVIQGGPDTVVLLGRVGADLTVSGVFSLHCGSVGGNCSVRDVRGEVEMSAVGHDLDVYEVGGRLKVGSVGGDARLQALRAAIDVGVIGGDLNLQADLPPGCQARLNVSGDASVQLPAQADLSLRVFVGGDVNGPGLSGFRGPLLTLLYGQGAARLEMNVAGDLHLRGATRPRNSARAAQVWQEFEQEMQDSGRLLERLGQELGQEVQRMMHDLAQELAGASLRQGARWSEEVLRTLDEQTRRAQQRAEEWERRFRRFQRRGPVERVQVRIQEREWRMDPERLQRILEQARRAAAEGIVGALEAVEQALQNLGLSVPDEGASSSSAGSPEAAAPRAGARTASETTTEAGAEAAAAGPIAGEPAEREQEREAILRMIAEGRLSPEEGDLLLEALAG
jgi:hypothetical protein